MQHLKLNNLIYFVVLISMTGCTISSYRVTKQWKLKTELHVTPDRILLECAHVTDEIELTHMFLIHILDEKNTVIDVVQGNNTSKKGCDLRMRGVQKVLDTGHDIYIGAIGDPFESVVIDSKNYTFPQYGTFRGNGRVLQFHVIANENGKCFGAYYYDEKPCPRDEFPITEH